MLVFAGITPHSPLLLPSIGKDDITMLEKTKQALQAFSDKVSRSHPDVIVVLTPHSSLLQLDTFNLIVSHPEYPSEYKAHLQEFGDYTTTFSYKTDPEILEQIISLSPEIPISTSFAETLDYGSVVPLSYILSVSQNTPCVVPISVSGLDRASHISYGKKLFDILSQSNKRIAVIASADLSHTLTDNSPAGFNQSGKTFDQTIRDYLKQRRLQKISEINEDLVEDAVSCGYNVLLLLVGILSHLKYEYQELMYEYPFGVGYLTGYFDFELYE